MCATQEDDGEEEGDEEEEEAEGEEGEGEEGDDGEEGEASSFLIFLSHQHPSLKELQLTRRSVYCAGALLLIPCAHCCHFIDRLLCGLLSLYNTYFDGGYSGSINI